MMERTYWASCAAGLECCLRSELEALDSTEVMSDSVSKGGVLFRTTTLGCEDLRKLRSADNIYAFVAHRKDVPLDKESGLKYLSSLASKVDWKPALDLHERWQQSLYGVERCCASSTVSSSRPSHSGRSSEDFVQDGDGEDRRVSFRVTGDRVCVKMKKQGYTSMDAAAVVGQGCCEVLGWKVNLRHYDVEVLAWVRDMEVLLVLGLLYGPVPQDDIGGRISNEESVNVTDDTISAGKGTATSVGDDEVVEQRLGSKRKLHRPSRSEAQLHSKRQYRKSLVGTSLKSSTAFALLQLAKVAPGHIVVDPMCGCGTVPLEAADWLQGQVMSLAGDLSSQAVDAAVANTAAGRWTGGLGVGGGGPCDVLQWDASRLPFRSGIVDRVVCDMPFGNRCGNARVRDWLCPKVVKEVVRILSPGAGIAVLMGQSKTMRRELEVTLKTYLELSQHLTVDMEGLSVDVFVLRRTMEPPPPVVDRLPYERTRKRFKGARSPLQATVAE